MSLFAIASVTGSPGVTTTSIGITLRWPTDRRVLVEASPFGSVLSPWYGVKAEPTITNYTVHVISGGSPYELGSFAKDLYRPKAKLAGSDGFNGALLPTVLGTANPDQESMTDAAWNAFSNGLATFDGDVICDMGTLLPYAQNQAAILARASVMVLVCKPDQQHVRAIKARQKLISHYCEDIRLVVVGNTPYSAKELAQATGLPLLAVLPNDKDSAALAGPQFPLASEKAQMKSVLLHTLGETAVALSGLRKGVRSNQVVVTLLQTGPKPTAIGFGDIPIPDNPRTALTPPPQPERAATPPQERTPPPRANPSLPQSQGVPATAELQPPAPVAPSTEGLGVEDELDLTFLDGIFNENTPPNFGEGGSL
ncbi:hypothetical protein [Ferrimicrobium acidiphilum]|uniref:hypothetical protein n=1 Tax=Ferrimicrobium acidiphilum TaxID=121039 RepID=UPI0023EFFD7D|nr:hypothetical protein [Ferrimicrobium acidiphilum]